MKLLLGILYILLTIPWMLLAVAIGNLTVGIVFSLAALYSYLMGRSVMVGSTSAIVIAKVTAWIQIAFFALFISGFTSAHIGIDGIKYGGEYFILAWAAIKLFCLRDGEAKQERAKW